MHIKAHKHSVYGDLHCMTELLKIQVMRILGISDVEKIFVYVFIIMPIIYEILKCTEFCRLEKWYRLKRLYCTDYDSPARLNSYSRMDDSSFLYCVVRLDSRCKKGMKAPCPLETLFLRFCESSRHTNFGHNQ
jgi:hypothetical protein